MRILLFILLLIPSLSWATCVTTAGKVPVTTTGSPTPTICDGDISDVNGNIGIGTPNPGRQLDVQGTLTFFRMQDTSGAQWHCKPAVSTGTFTCTSGA